MSGKSKLIYLLAASHSGSTLTAMLLGAHPQVSCVGELKANHLGDTDKYLCSCRNKISDCDFWSAISDRMSHLGEEYTVLDAQTDIRSGASTYDLRLLKPLVRNSLWEAGRDFCLQFSANWKNNLEQIQRRNTYLIKSILEETNTQMIVDSSKIGIRLKYLLRNPDLEIKIVWLVRDGRGVSLAYRNPSEFADAKDQKMRGGGMGKTIEKSRDVAHGAHEWRRCNEEAMNVLATTGKDNWLKVRYEDICQDTESTLDKIFDFIGVDSSQKVIDYRSGDHHMVGNGMRLDTTSVIEMDNRWKTELTNADLDQFDKVAGKLNRSLGYQ